MRRTRLIFRVVVLLVVAVIWARRRLESANGRAAAAPPPTAPTVHATLAAPPDTAGRARASAGLPVLPDSVLTPGATLPVTAADVCTPGYAHKVRNVPASVKREVYAEYGIAHHAPGDFEVDHLISLELGGSNSKRNLWPESYHTTPWNARVKDAVENELHRRVCKGSLDLKTAQHEIASNWISAYQRYVHQTRASASDTGGANAR